MARSFNGTSDWYNTSARQGPQSSVTFACWAKPTAVNSSQQTMFSIVQFGSGNTAYNQFFINASGGINFRIFGNPFSSQQIGRTTANSAVTAGAWSSFVGTWNGGTTAASIQVFLNGSQVDTTNDNAGTFSAVNTPSIPIYIGAQNNNTGASPTFGNGFGGSIADCAIWTVALSAGEISALAQGARPYTIRPLSLYFWAPLDGLQTTEPDLSGNAVNATVLGGGPALAFGPPFMQQTPRWPLNSPFRVVASTFQPAWAMRNRIVVEGIGI